MFLNIEVWKNSSQRKQIFSRNLNLFFLLKQHKKINVFIYGVEVVVVIFQFFIIFKLISAKYTLFHIFRSRVKKKNQQRIIKFIQKYEQFWRTLFNLFTRKNCYQTKRKYSNWYRNNSHFSWWYTCCTILSTILTNVRNELKRPKII